MLHEFIGGLASDSLYSMPLRALEEDIILGAELLHECFFELFEDHHGGLGNDASDGVVNRVLKAPETGTLLQLKDCSISPAWRINTVGFTGELDKFDPCMSLLVVFSTIEFGCAGQ